MPQLKNVGAKQLTLEQRRERRKLRREKQRHENIGRAAEMHAARMRLEVGERAERVVRLGGPYLCRVLRMVLLEMAWFVLPR